MQFQIVREISSGRKRIDGRMVDTVQAAVRFTDGDATRHLVQQPNGSLTGWNSDSARRERAGILVSHAAHQAAVATIAARVQKLTDALGELKNKRGREATQDRKILREALKVAQAVAAVASSDAERAAEIAGKVDETHPEIVQFV